MPYGLTPQQKVLILVVMEDALARLGLESICTRLEIVLILVVMEDALAQLPNEGRCIGLNVLILVVMEEALAQVKIFSPISLG